MNRTDDGAGDWFDEGLDENTCRVQTYNNEFHMLQTSMENVRVKY